MTVIANKGQTNSDKYGKATSVNLECVFSNSLESFVKFYRSNISLQERRQLTIAASKGRLDYKTSTVIREQEEEMLNILELPSSLQLLLLSYLDVHSLCQVSQTCKLLNNVASDHLLWEKILKRDLRTWTLLNYQSYPQIFLDAGADLETKQIYARCYSGNEKTKNYKPADESFLTKLLKFAPFYQKTPPRVQMFGPGLEASTSGLVHKLLWNEISPFCVQDMFSGLEDGVGSGLSLKYNESEIVNLIITYSSTKKEREAAAKDGSPVKNKMLLDEDDKLLVHEVNHSVRQLCKTIDAFIFVVDSSTSKEKVSKSKDLLLSMMDERWTSKKAPLLVLSCAKDAVLDKSMLTCVDVVEGLELSKMNRHWQVTQVVVETLEGIHTAINWLLKECSSY
ncbi:F-box only protein 4-like [Dendronephthya gigantea]|uniref:F-box only protein 4-like n=1 Tax=Dendronephthya gigantea TaxID=151771 RepID=UPI00106A47B0|nr:F-box only protein 4-like [Dendronephthya gigantea]